MMYESKYVTNSNNLKKVVGYKYLHFINNEYQDALSYKTLKSKDTVTSFRDNNALGHFFACVLHVFSYVTAFKISLIYV